VQQQAIALPCATHVETEAHWRFLEKPF